MVCGTFPKVKQSSSQGEEFIYVRKHFNQTESHEKISRSEFMALTALVVKTSKSIGTNDDDLELNANGLRVF